MAAFTALLTLRRLRSLQRFGNWAKWIEQTQVFTHPSRTLSVFSLQKKSTKKTKSLQRNGTCLELWPWSTCSHHHDSTTNNSLYDQTFAKSMSDPKRFWAEAAESLVWEKKWDKVLDDSNLPFSQWFIGGKFNTTYNAVDRHVENGLGDRIALIYDSAVTDTICNITYAELLNEVKHFAGVLQKHGVSKGDRVLIYMPAIPQTIIAMLASARIGAIHSVVFGGFGSRELSTRIQHAKPKVIVSANCGIEPKHIVHYKPLLDKAIEMSSHKPSKCIIYNRPKTDPATMIKDQDVCYLDEMVSAKPVDCVPILATDPLYILYTSGTTGIPKAVVRPSGGHAVALKWAIQNVYGIKPSEVWWAASDLGWVVGHSFIAYGPLLNGNTSILFEGKPVGTPDAGSYFRVIKQHDVHAMFLAPTALRAIIREDPKGETVKKYLPLDKFRAMFVAGEHCDKHTMQWTKNLIQKPVLDNWWQTETSWPITSTCLGLDMNTDPPYGVSGKPVPGWDVKVLSPDGKKDAEPEDLGQIVVKLPLPPGAFSTLWENDEGFKEIYFSKYPGYYNSMDSGLRDKQGYISVLSRSDDVINVSGHRLSTGALEEAIMQISDVADAVVIGVPDQLKGQIPLGLCVLKTGVKKDNDEVISDIIETVRNSIGPVACFKQAIVVPGLPKTRSGKIARNTIAAMAAGKPFQIPVTIEDPNVYPPIRTALQSIGFAKGAQIPM